MERRKDWLKFQKIIELFDIHKLYHFTDRANLESIIKNGGLFAWGECKERGITISRPGGSELSRSLDDRDGLQNYVRLSICKHHPMLYNAMQDGRIKEPVLLEIDIDVLYIKGNVFSDRNAVKTGAIKGDSFEHFNNIHFQTALKKSMFDVCENEQEFYQAEILVKQCVPLNYISNIKDFIKQDNKLLVGDNKLINNTFLSNKKKALVFIISQSINADVKIYYQDKEISRGEVICDSVNQIIHNIVLRYYHANLTYPNYDIAVVGYGDYSFNCFSGNLKYKDFVSLEELHNNQLYTKYINKKIKTRQGIVNSTTEFPVWINHQSCGRANLSYALNRTLRIIEDWIRSNKESEPPVVIHITDSGYSDSSDEQILLLANTLKATYTNQGNTIFTNVLFTNDRNLLIFPKSVSELGNYRFFEMYFLMSSFLPIKYNNTINTYRKDYESPLMHKAFAANVKALELVKAINTFIL